MPAGEKAGIPIPALERAAAMMDAVSDVPRLAILACLRDGALPVSVIARTLGDPVPATSQRLRILREAGLVTGVRHGREVHYALADRHVSDLLLALLAHADEVCALAHPFPWSTA